MTLPGPDAVAGIEGLGRTAFVLGASADIGLALCGRLLEDGWRVIAAARDSARLGALRERAGFRALGCDLGEPASIAAMIDGYAGIGWPWDLFVSAAGTMEPIGPFFELDFDDWQRSVEVNSTAQLRVLHGLWTQRSRTRGRVDAMLLAGGGTNSPFTNYSAYCVAKIALIKMCELLDDEAPELNVFIVGPGYVRTRIHEETLQAGERAGPGLAGTRAFLESDRPGTTMEEIYAQLAWCLEQGRAVCGGRNFSTVHDPWRDGGQVLARSLRGDRDAYRLRRAQPTGSAD